MNLKKTILTGASVLLIGGASGCGFADALDDSTITDSQYENAAWKEYDTRYQGPIAKAFEAENMGTLPTSDWHKYMYKIREYEYNNGKIEGSIKVPDLDGDGKVGK